MQKPWSLRLVDKLHDPVATGQKDIDLRLEVQASETRRSTAWLIEQMRQYQVGDTLILEFAQGKTVDRTLQAQITAETEQKPLGELTDEECARIEGEAESTKARIIELLRGFYPENDVNEATIAHLAHFRLTE